MEAISREEQFWYSLAYFFGAWLGDGHYIYNPYGKSYEIGFVSMDQEILNKVIVELERTIVDLNKHCLYEEISKSGTKLYRLQYHDKIFTDFVCKATAYKTMLPNFVWTAPKDVRLELLSGLMDTDGTIVIQKSPGCKDGFFYTLKFSGTRGFVSQFPDLCRVIGIKITSVKDEYHDNPNHADRKIFNISLPSAVDNGFRFYCRRKQARLQDYLDRRSTRYSRMSDTKMQPSETIRQTPLQEMI